MADIVERLRGWSGQAAPVSSTDIYAVTQEAAAEIERLREEVLQAGAMIFNQARTVQSLLKARDEALEEAAKVADGEAGEYSWAGEDRNVRLLQEHGHELAAAIRALKEKQR